MYNFFGRLVEITSFWFPPARRIARNNRRDVGKIMVYSMAMDAVGMALLWFLFRKGTKEETIEETLVSKMESVTPETFKARFGTLKQGDTVIFKHGDENIEGWFQAYTSKGNLVVGCYVGTEDGAAENLTVMLPDVLDVTPAF